MMRRPPREDQAERAVRAARAQVFDGAGRLCLAVITLPHPRRRIVALEIDGSRVVMLEIGRRPEIEPLASGSRWHRGGTVAAIQMPFSDVGRFVSGALAHMRNRRFSRGKRNVIYDESGGERRTTGNQRSAIWRANGKKRHCSRKDHPFRCEPIDIRRLDLLLPRIADGRCPELIRKNDENIRMGSGRHLLAPSAGAIGHASDRGE